MASLDFELEKRIFRKFYDNHRPLFEEAKNGYIQAVNSLKKSIPNDLKRRINALSALLSWPTGNSRKSATPPRS